MSKKDYELFASIIHWHWKQGELDEIELDLLISTSSEFFKQDNFKFNQAKYERACRTGAHIRKSIANA